MNDERGLGCGGVLEPDFGAAGGAAGGLGVEAAVGGVGVFGGAGGAHGEGGHGGEWAVVGDALDDGEAWAAVGAVDEAVGVAAVGGVEEFAEAVGADGGVGRHRGGSGGTEFRIQNFEFRIFWDLDCGDGFLRDGFDFCEGREFGLEAVGEAGDGFGWALEFDDDAGGVVLDGAGEAFFGGEAVDVRAEADALDLAGDVEANAGE